MNKRIINIAVIFTLIFINLCKIGESAYNSKIKSVFTAQVTIQYKGKEFIHIPVDEINILGDQIVLQVKLNGISDYTNIYLYYKRGDESTFKKMVFSPKIRKGINNYSGEVIIPSYEFTTAGIDYYIVAKAYTNSFEDWKFKSKNSPQKITYIDKGSILFNSENNTLELKDGNSYDGECLLKISDYENNNKITFYQYNNIDSLPENNCKNVLSKKPVVAYTIEPKNKMLAKSSKLQLLYFDINQDGKEDIKGYKESLLKIYWYDGYEWRYIGGNVDNIKNIITSDIYQFGILGIFPVKSVEIDDFRPKEHILTLDNNDVNDRLIFNGLDGDFEIRIIDINGKLIKIITDRPYWDGKDMNGNIVSSGVYMYQLKKAGKVIK